MLNRSLVSAFTTVALLTTAATTALAYDEEDETGEQTDGDPSSADDEAWRVVASASPSFGEDWGAGLSIRASVGGIPAAQSDSFRDELNASVRLGAIAKINGSTTPLAAIDLRGYTISGRSSQLVRHIWIWQFIVNTQRTETDQWLQQQLTLEATPLATTFFDKRVNLWVGPVPVTFTATAVGEVGGYVRGRIDTLGVSAETGPFARAVLNASGAIGGEWCVPYVGPCIGASAGVEVQLKLVDISAPARVTVTSFGANTENVRVEYDVDLSTRLEMLSGYLRVFAEAHIGSAGDRWHATLWDWGGHTDAQTLGQGHGTHCLTGDCALASSGAGDGTGLTVTTDPVKPTYTAPSEPTTSTVETKSAPTTTLTYTPTTTSVKR